MRRLSLALILVLSLACAGDPEPGEAPPPAEPAPAPADDAAGSASPPERVSIVGAARVGLPAEWQRANEFTRMLYDGELEALYEHFSDGAKAELSLEALQALRQGMLANYGEETEVLDTVKEEKEGYRAYKRLTRFSNETRRIEIAWVIDPENLIAGIYVTPERDAAP